MVFMVTWLLTWSLRELHKLGSMAKEGKQKMHKKSYLWLKRMAEGNLVHLPLLSFLMRTQS